MPFSTKAELKTAALDWMKRASLSGDADDFITLGEAVLNREIGAVETSVDLTGTTDGDTIDITDHSVVNVLALYRVPDGCDEIYVIPKPLGSYPKRSTSDKPFFWSANTDTLEFDCPLDQAYAFRAVIRQRFALASDSSSNWLLERHPDAYLAATLVEAFARTEMYNQGLVWQGRLDNAIAGIRRDLARSKRAVLTVDPALRATGRTSYNDLISGDF